MCGIAGVWGGSSTIATEILNRMSVALHHRGPDSHGLWSDDAANLHFVHNRLAIQDLSSNGHQPMLSHSGKTCIAYNGEIYNHKEIRSNLARYHDVTHWNGDSDTETLLEAIEILGLEEALEQLDGMFAFALWDRSNHSLYLARDRFGEKPLYFGQIGGQFVFCSELHAVRVNGLPQPNVSHDAVADFLRHSSVPAPYSIYEEFNKLMPGHYLKISDRQSSEYQQKSYWDLDKIARNGIRGADDYSEEHFVDLITSCLKDSVSKRLISDVEIGAFLSGGVDSSLVTALMQEVSNKPVKTFSIGFSEKGHNEAPYAKAVAEHLKTDHTELYVTSGDALEVVPQLGSMWDEPFADSSQIPTFLVSKLSRSSVTVALTGDGGDELFGGYQRYADATRIWNRIDRIPKSVRNVTGATTTALLTMLDSMLFEKDVLSESRFAANCKRLKQLSPLFRSGSQDDLYKYMMMHWKNPEQIMIKGRPNATYDFSKYGEFSYLGRMMLYDIHRYLPNTILTKVDRASMQVSLESRAPLLNHHLYELAWKIPDQYKNDGVGGKLILKKVLDQFVPRDLIERPKMGFGVPIAQWLRGPLKEWAFELLDERAIREQGFFDTKKINSMWIEHQKGVHDWHYYLWDILMFQAWYNTVNSQQ